MRELDDLCHRLGISEPLDYDPLWSAAPDFLGLIVDHCLVQRPQRILECSTGTSTLMLAAACRANGHGRVVSLENDTDCAERSRAQLRRHRLDNFAEVLHAPLRDYRLDDADYRWYELDYLEPGPYDLLVIDGPPGRLQSQARYPALPLLMERLTDSAVIFLDDADRPDEKAIVHAWQKQWPQLTTRSLPSERGCRRFDRNLPD